MVHKALIGGTSYNVINGRCLINGTMYNVVSGKTLIDGTKYNINLIAPLYAMYYSDGSMVFQRGRKSDENKTLYGEYVDFENSQYTSIEDVPWHEHRTSLKNISFKNEVIPKNMDNWFVNCTSLSTNISTLTNLNMNEVVSMSNTYYRCISLIGSPICGDNVTNMYGAYSNCFNLTGNPACGNKVTDISYAYDYCSNLYGTMEIFSKNIKAVTGCFFSRNTSNRLNIYVYNGSTTHNTIRNKITRESIVGTDITWTDDVDCFYNAEQNIYVYTTLS